MKNSLNNLKCSLALNGGNIQPNLANMDAPDERGSKSFPASRRPSTGNSRFLLWPRAVTAET